MLRSPHRTCVIVLPSERFLCTCSRTRQMRTYLNCCFENSVTFSFPAAARIAPPSRARPPRLPRPGRLSSMTFPSASSVRNACRRENGEKETALV